MEHGEWLPHKKLLLSLAMLMENLVMHRCSLTPTAWPTHATILDCVFAQLIVSLLIFWEKGFFYYFSPSISICMCIQLISLSIWPLFPRLCRFFLLIHSVLLHAPFLACWNSLNAFYVRALLVRVFLSSWHRRRHRRRLNYFVILHTLHLSHFMQWCSCSQRFASISPARRFFFAVFSCH